jgi:hypothetical protein
MTIRSRLLWPAVALTASLLLVSCGDDETETDTGGTTTIEDAPDTTTGDSPDTTGETTDSTAPPTTAASTEDPYGY